MRLLFTSIFCCAVLGTHAQSYYGDSPVMIPGNGQSISDTLTVSNLTPGPINGSFGLDSITLKLDYGYDEDLLISLTAPDGTVLQLTNNLGWGSNFDNTSFTMGVSDLVNMKDAPFSGEMRPESWMGRVNNGQNANGNWVLRIINTTSGNSTGTLLKWGLHFDNTPAPPEFFNQSTLPIVVVNTNNVIMQHNIKNEVNGTMGIIDNISQSNIIGDAFNGYDGNIAIKVRGNSSASFPQRSYTLTTTDANNDDNEVSLLGMSTGSKWVLYGAWTDKSLLRNILAYQLSNEMGAYAPRTHLCELVINGDYKGVYVLMEKIKRDDNRVPVEKLSANTVSGPDLTGGYIFQVDRAGSDSWQSQYPPCPASDGVISFVYEYPAEDKINSAQKDYIAGYVDSFETALMNLDLYDTLSGYRHFIDVNSFIEQSILQELGHNVDGYRLSSFLHKAKNKKLRAGPLWDMNLAFGNADYFDGAVTNTFEWDLPCPFNDGNLNPFWWKKLESDTSYMNAYKCRYTTLRQSVLDTVHIDHIIDSFKNVLLTPQIRQFTRWPILGVYLWPNAFVGNTWQEEINYLKEWTHERIRWMDTQLYNTSCIPVPPLAINERDETGSVLIFPNPASSELNIECGSAYIRNIHLYNMTGQLVWEGKVSGSNKKAVLNSKGIPAGIYSISIDTDKGILKRKVIIR